MSKIPPQLRQLFHALLQYPTAITLRHSAPLLEYFLATAQDFVERFLEVGGALRELLPHLRNILFEALLYLFPEQLLEGAVAQPLGVFRGMIGDDVGDESPRQAFRPLVRILCEEWIDRLARGGRP